MQQGSSSASAEVWITLLALKTEVNMQILFQ